MNTIKQVIKKVKEKLRKKSFWLPDSVGKMVEQEAAKKEWKSESVLMTHIIREWFKK